LFYEVPKFLADLSSDFCLDVFFTEEVQGQVKKALTDSGKWNERVCPLQAPLVLWFVIAMTVFRPQSMASILKQLLKAFRQSMPDLFLREVTPEAVCHARKRLGIAPLKLMFEATSEQARKRRVSFFNGLRVWAIDGVRFLIPDNDENESAFGRPKTSRGRAAFPQMLAVALVDVTTRLVCGCVFGRSDASERAGARELLESLSEGDLVLLDRGFPCGDLFEQCKDRGIHFLARISSIWKPQVNRVYGPGCCEVKVRSWIPYTESELDESDKKPRKGRPRKGRDVEFELRMIEYRIGQEPPVRLLTSMNASDFEARALALLYHQRWEVELAYDELKTHLATVNHGTLHTTFRSKTPDGVRQETYGMLIAYNLVRGLIAEAAQTHGRDPLEISFVQSLRLIQNALSQVVPVQSVVDAEANRRLLLDDIARCINRPRRKRSYPRKVKIKMSNFGVKTPEDQGRTVDFAAELELRKIDATSQVAA
jgi:hypothetical protein